MSLDTRVIDPVKVIALVENKINTNNFSCRLYAYNKDELIYDFIIGARHFDYNFYYNYRPKEMSIHDMNKFLKRRNNGKGITTEELVADDMYQKFLSEWIGMAKNKNLEWLKIKI